MMIKQTTFLLGLLLFSSFGRGQSSSVDLTTANEMDIEKYLGKWYEIARYDHIFERGLVGVTAEYSWRDDGKIKVANKGFKKSLDGKKSESTGKAKFADPNVPSKMKVAFFANFYTDYYVLEVDEDYQWALVGSSTDKYLWILSRTPKMEESLYKKLLGKLSKRGFDLSKLIRVKQKIN